MVDSTDGPDGRLVSANPLPGDMIGVEEALVQDLAGSYAQYRQALAGPFDPVKTLALTGDVLRSVSIILTAIGYRPGEHPVNTGKARK